ncbi:tetratricopeptide repeat protein, partial [Bacillus sp. JJ722]|uniref:tetratricopeptide repeat protein n=1 Tax=Bacillus sp. JJ722 TaxID=3122973 RepID=UPI002FFE3628
YALGNLYYDNDKLMAAKDQFEKAIKVGLHNSDCYFMLGMTLQQLDQPKLAMPYIQRSVELNPEDNDARFQYALCLANAELYEELIKVLEEVLERDPKHADALYNLGVAYAGHLEDAEKALECFTKALEAQSDHMLAANGKKIMEQVLAE